MSNEIWIIVAMHLFEFFAKRQNASLALLRQISLPEANIEACTHTHIHMFMMHMLVSFCFSRPLALATYDVVPTTTGSNIAG